MTKDDSHVSIDAAKCIQMLFCKKLTVSIPTNHVELAGNFQVGTTEKIAFAEMDWP
jgi:hypothetical protein